MSTIATNRLTFPERVTLAVRRSGVTNGKIADTLGVHRNTVSGWLSGIKRPTPRSLEGLAKITGTTVAWLTDGIEPTAVDLTDGAK